MADGSGAPFGTAEELDSLARDWITLWQSELSALAADREAQEAWTALLGLWAGAAAAFLAAAPRAVPGFATSFRHDPGPAGPAAAPRPAPAAAAPDPRDAALDRLNRRLAELEARLAEIERGKGGGRADRRRARGKPGGDGA